MPITNYQQDKQIDSFAKNDFYSLYKVFGFGSHNNYSFSYSPENGLTAFLAGPYVILYDISLDKQISYMKNVNNKIISCVTFSKNGKYLATGEGNCKNGEVRIYEIEYNKHTGEETHFSTLSYKNHKHGIDKLIFFKNDSYILSIGNNDDKTMIIMDIYNKQIIFSSKYNRPILASDACNEFMVLAGSGFIKIYNYEKLLNETQKSTDLDTSKTHSMVEKKLVELSKLRDKSFISTIIYEKEEKKIFFMTYDCYLVEMKSNFCTLNRWVHLKSTHGLSLTTWNNMLGCGCSDGVYRIFNADNLGHVTTLNKPPPLGSLNIEINLKKNNIKNSIYADIIGSLYNNVHKKLVVIYSDKSCFIYDMKNVDKITVYKYDVFHHGSIKSMDYNIDKENNLIKIVTCSDDDNTVIYWNLKLDGYISNNLNNNIKDNSIRHILYSKNIRHIFYLGKNFDNFKIKKDDILCTFNNNNEENNENEIFNLTTVKFTPDSKFLVIGDSVGNIYIFSLDNKFEKIIEIPAHNGEINTIDLIDDKENSKSYLSSGGSDNFVSIIDISNGISSDLNFTENAILEKMDSPVINVVFCIDKNKKLKLIVAEVKTITFFQLLNGTLQSLQKFYDENLNTYCLSYSPAIKKVISGHNGKISIWKTSSNIAHKHFQVNKGDKLLDNFRIASDSTGVMFATSNNDKIIRIRALHDGKLLTKIPVSESISAMFFILDDNYLIATSVEGYLYFYKLNMDLIKKLKADNDLINSTEERNIINNKLKLLQKFMENDTSLSKNSQVKYLLDKFQRSEEATIDDLKKLDGFVKVGKKNQNKEIIELKEDKPNNNDDQENQNNEDNNYNNYGIGNTYDNKLNCLNCSKSKMFEKGLKDRISDTSVFKKNKDGRISLTDSYSQKGSFVFNYKIKPPKEDIKDININKEEEIKENLEEDVKFSNININQEFENKENLNNSDIKEDIKVQESCRDFKENIVNNSQTQLSQTHLNNLIITQTSMGYNSIIPNSFMNKIKKIKPVLNIIKENMISFENSNKKIIGVSKVNDFKIVDNSFKKNTKEKLIKDIKSGDIKNINDEDDLKELEKQVENMLMKVRFKLANRAENNIMDKIADKYSSLILDNLNNKK